MQNDDKGINYSISRAFLRNLIFYQVFFARFTSFLGAMEKSFLQKILKNPAFGLIPLFVFSFLIGMIDIYVSYLIAFLLSVAGFLSVKRHSRLLYDISVITFSLSSPFIIFFGSKVDSTRFFVAVEIIFVLSLIVSRLSRPKIILRLARNDNPSARNYLNESFRVAFLAQYGLSIHLLLVLALFLFSVDGLSLIEIPIVKIAAQLILLAIMGFESLELNILNNKLKHEDWLPVVNEKGDITGKIAKSVTKDLKNKFMHPVVRVALIFDGKIYLTKRENNRILDPGKLDYPFEKYMNFDDDLDSAVHEAIASETKNDQIPLRFLLKYVFENATTKRLIFLYVSEIETEEMFNSLQLEGGKFWTESQIEDNLGHNLFCECFEMEYEYLKNTVLLFCKHKKVGSLL